MRATVYVSPAANSYPLSAYSYLVNQCAPTSQVATCKGRYPRVGKENVLAPVDALHRV
jgi:hypothetical protein